MPTSPKEGWACEHEPDSTIPSSRLRQSCQGRTASRVHSACPPCWRDVGMAHLRRKGSTPRRAFCRSGGRVDVAVRRCLTYWSVQRSMSGLSETFRAPLAPPAPKLFRSSNMVVPGRRGRHWQSQRHPARWLTSNARQTTTEAAVDRPTAADEAGVPQRRSLAGSLARRASIF
jgi:hypothetical protein